MAFYGHRVKEFMRRELVTCRIATPLTTLADRLSSSASDMLLVVDDDGYALVQLGRNNAIVLPTGDWRLQRRATVVSHQSAASQTIWLLKPRCARSYFTKR